MFLKGRLKTIADMVDVCESLCDIGTDHAYLPIYLVMNGISRKALACDIVDGPIQRAERNIEKYGLSDDISVRKGYGLMAIEPGEADTIIIAGMGGVLISEILEEGMDKINGNTTLVLQPMNAPEVLREWLYLNKFAIGEEKLVEDEGKLYCVIKAVYIGVVARHDDLYYHVGEELVRRKDPLLEEYLKKRIGQLEKEIKGLQKSTTSEPDLVIKASLKNKMQSLLADITKYRECEQ